MGALLVSPAGAQAAPNLTASPSTANPGDTITLTAAGCADAPRLGYQAVDGSGATFEVDTTADGAGTYSADIAAPVGDLYAYFLFGECGVGSTIVESPIARVDVEAPLLYASPSPQLPELIQGTDCPPGATPAVTLTTGGERYDIGELEVDEFGDWFISAYSGVLPVLPAGPSTVQATCGDLVYDTLTLDPPGRPEEPTPPAVAPAPAPVASAPSATPVPGSARFTG